MAILEYDEQTTIKVQRNAWNSAKDKILEVLKAGDYNFEAIFEDRFKKKRRFSGISGFTVSLVAFLLTLGATFQGRIRVVAPNDNPSLILLNLIVIFLVVPGLFGTATGFVWATLFKYHEINWIEVQFGKNFVYVGFKSKSKTWLARFIDDLKDAGVSMEESR